MEISSSEASRIQVPRPLTSFGHKGPTFAKEPRRLRESRAKTARASLRGSKAGSTPLTSRSSDKQERRPTNSRGSPAAGKLSAPRKEDYMRRSTPGSIDMKPWDVEPEWRRKEKEQNDEREACEVDMELMPESALPPPPRLISRVSYTSLDLSSDEEHNHKTEANRPTTAVADTKTIKRTRRRPRPHTCAGTRTDAGGSIDSGAESDDTRNKGSELDFGVDIVDDKGWDTDLEIEEVKEPPRPLTDGEDPVKNYDHTGRFTYLEACRKEEQIPVSYFVRNIGQPELCMRHHGLGCKGSRNIAIALVSNTLITHLDLTDNWLGPQGGISIMEMLKENCYITDVNLSDNHIGPAVSEALCKVLEVNTSINRLILSGNDLDDTCSENIADAVASNQRLEVLNLSHNRFNEPSGVWFGSAISENTALRDLDLSWNSIRRRGAVAVANGIKGNVFMKKINLSWNGMGSDGAKALGDALKHNNTLEELDISNNRITTEGAVLIGKGLSVNEALRVLLIGQNPMQSAGCFAVVTAVMKNQACLLEKLDFTDITVNDDFKNLWEQAKELLPSLSCCYGPKMPVREFKEPVVTPIMKLLNYVNRNNLRLIDFFNKFDKDGSMSVSREEFLEGLKEMKITMSDDEIGQLISELDRDGDGEINYSELVTRSMKG